MYSPNALSLLSTAFLLSLLPSRAQTAYICNGSVAQPGPPYINAVPVGVSVSHPPSGPTATGPQTSFPSATAGFDWGQAGTDAVNDIGFRSKVRRAEDEGDEEFKCAYFETCLLDGGGVDASGQVVDGGRLFCYEPFNGEAEYMDGYELSFATGTYYTPDNERGNLLEGPCPGEIYEPSPTGGCQPAKRSKEDAGDRDDGSASATPSTSTLPKSTAAESAGVEATVTGQTNNGDGLNSCHGPVWMVMYLAMMIAGVLL